MFLAYSVSPSRLPAIYAWREKIVELPRCQADEAGGAALTFINRLEQGDLSAAMECARWLLEHKPERCQAETFSLGPRFSFAAGWVCDSNGQRLVEVTNA